MTNKSESKYPGFMANCNCNAGLSFRLLNNYSSERFLFSHVSLFVFLGFQLILFCYLYTAYFSFDSSLGAIVDASNFPFALYLGTVLNGFSYHHQDVYGSSTSSSSSSGSSSITSPPPTPSINHLPTAYSGVSYTTRDAPVSITLRATDQDGEHLTFFPSLLITKTAHGKLGPLTDYSTTSSLTTARISYFPDRGYIGSDSFSYQAADTNNAASNVATINLIIR